MAGFSWSAPGMTREADPAAVQSRFQFQRQYHSPLQGGQGALAGQNQLGIATQQALGSVAQIMQQRKNDQIAQTLLQSKAAGGDPLAQKIMAMKLSPSIAWNEFNQEQNDAQQGEMYRLNHLFAQQRVGEVAAPKDANKSPIWLGGQEIQADPATAMQYWYGGAAQKPDPWTNAIATARGWMKSNGTFTNSASDAHSDNSAIPANADASQAPYVKLVEPNSKAEKVVPWSAYAGRTGQIVGQAKQSVGTQPNSAAGALSGPGIVPGSGNQPGPNDAQIRFLQSNPNTKDQFDAKFGQGASSAYLNP